jgi:hypothetical protein
VKPYLRVILVISSMVVLFILTFTLYLSVGGHRNADKATKLSSITSAAEFSNSQDQEISSTYEDVDRQNSPTNSLNVKTANSNETVAASASNITDTDLRSVRLDDFAKTNWDNVGFASISSLVETYYWSMREGDVGRLLECMSAREQPPWKAIVNYHGETILGPVFRSAISNVTLFRLSMPVSVSLQTGSQFVIKVTHLSDSGTIGNEYLALAKENEQWRIDGVRGCLNSHYHGGQLPFTDILEQLTNEER